MAFWGLIWQAYRCHPCLVSVIIDTLHITNTMRLQLATLGLLLSCLVSSIEAFCQPGCTCFDEGRDVRCDNANLTAFPYMLNPMLRSLSLVNTKLKNLDAASISVYQELEVLDLSSNGIEELPSNFLVGFPKLRKVKLANNKIRLISDDLFKDLPALEGLDISRNHIERIMVEAFAELKALVSLNLSSNRLQNLSPKTFLGLDALSELDLSSNRYEKLNREAFTDLKDLAFLTVAKNKLKFLPRLVFTEQKKLVKLDVSQNGIATIEEGAFSGLHSLKSLDLSANELSDISSRNWPYLAELELLDLSRNNFATIYAGFFEGLGSLRSLILTANDDLQRVELNAFAGLYKLDSIALNNCPRLVFIDEFAFEHPNQLTAVAMNDNGLQAVSLNLLNWRQLQNLELSGNPWNCDCELLRFLPDVLGEIRRRNGARSTESRPICSAPEALKGVALETTTAGATCTSLTEPALVAVMAASGIIILITVLIAVACVRSKALCCRSADDKEANLSRAPLYTGGSSFTDSLTYDKTGEPLFAHHHSHGGRTLPVPKANRPLLYAAATSGPINNGNDPSGDYYSSIVLPPGHCTLPLHYGDDASPYAMGSIRDHYTMRPPSFFAPPPPPPSMPPPPLSSAHGPVPSTEL
uniref:LRRCT domain-containing protein n=1 Tax=Panagrellus redivivus TaxID=6233 RepID=A0A7E4VVA4_PANRE